MYMCIYIYIYVYVCMYIYIYIYIYIYVSPRQPAARRPLHGRVQRPRGALRPGAPVVDL